MALVLPAIVLGQDLRSVPSDSSLTDASRNAPKVAVKQDPNAVSFPQKAVISDQLGSNPCEWSAATASPIPILDQATTAIGTNLYTFAGVGSGAILATAQKYDGTSWSSIASVPVALEFPTAASNGTSAYIIAGVDGTGTSVNTLYRYNPGTNDYTTLASAPTATWNSASVYLNGKIYKIGGYVSAGGTTTSSAALDVYDVAGNTWSSGAPYPVAQGWMSAFTDGTYLYVGGGVAAEAGSVPSTKTYRYDPGTNTWDDAAIADLPISRWGGASSVTSYRGGWVISGGYVGGTATANLSATAVKWDPVANSWSSLPDMMAARARMTGAVIGNAFHVIGGRSSAGGFNGTNDNQRLFCVDPNTPFLVGGVNYVSDNGTPANGVPDPGETVTVSLAINNIGGTATGSVVGTLAASGGIANPSGPVTYGVIAAGSSATQNFTFQVPADAPCGSQITLTFDIADGATHYPATKSYNLGVLQTAFSQNFDAVSAPNLPSSWVQNQTSGTGITWTTVTSPANSSPNSAFANDPGAVNATAIESPAFNISSANSVLTFKNYYDTEDTFDGAVLEIKIGSGAWTDFVVAGGAFTSGGYNAVISTGFQSPIGGRNAWSGDSAGYITTTATFPASANGQSVQLRWLMASDSSVAATGISIDDVAVTSGYVCGGSTTSVKSRADFDGDGKTDFSVFRPSEGNWYALGSTAGFGVLHWGAAGDVIVPGDYDGDGKADLAVWRANDTPGVTDFYILNSNGFTVTGISHGSTGDIPVAGDFDGDGKADAVVFRPSDNNWYIFASQAQTTTVIPFGASGDVPVSIDPDGDGKANLAVYRPSEGNWYIQNATGSAVNVFAFGSAGDRLVPADYDGDDKDDIAVFRPSNGTWYILNSSNGSVSYIPFGTSGDVAVPGDYDGDGKDDVAVYRNGVWYVNRSTAGFTVANFGLGTDQPIPAGYIPAQN
ncbi:MAG TPA: FG-GAP-like repeat-containing protein [Pyrinomonadaceae bacterium]|nr:FG-GAP-like repeat-containing protein [Pyrinomonadaceae bacterium]